MRKIISLYQRNYDGDRLVRDEVVPGSDWVLAGEGIATCKFDGTCCLVQNGQLWKRYDAKHGETPPDGFIAAQDPDPITGHWPGWILVGDGPDDRRHREAFALGHDEMGNAFRNGATYELCGPGIQGNSEGMNKPWLVAHGSAPQPACPRDFEGIKEYLRIRTMEGIVWHHPDGRMVKIKRKDFFKVSRIDKFYLAMATYPPYPLEYIEDEGKE